MRSRSDLVWQKLTLHLYFYIHLIGINAHEYIRLHKSCRFRVRIVQTYSHKCILYTFYAQTTTIVRT